MTATNGDPELKWKNLQTHPLIKELRKKKLIQCDPSCLGYFRYGDWRIRMNWEWMDIGRAEGFDRWANSTALRVAKVPMNRRDLDILLDHMKERKIDHDNRP